MPADLPADMITRIVKNEDKAASDCRAGSCGLCRMQLRGGEVKWQLTPECALAPGEILPSVCQPEGDLQLA